MVPTIGQISQEAVSESWEIRLARSAVAHLGASLSQEVQEELAQQVLKRLLEDKTRRRISNLNHWSEYAPGRVSRLAERAMNERNARIAAYLKSHRKAIRELAWRITRSWDLAERAIVQTCMELWEGRTREGVFLRALKMNARDVLALRNLERGRFESLDTARSGPSSSRAELLRDLEVEPDQADFASPRLEDQDPLDILIQREEQAEVDRMVASATKDPRWRYIKRREWATPLREECAELAGSFE